MKATLVLGRAIKLVEETIRDEERVLPQIVDSIQLEESTRIYEGHKKLLLDLAGMKQMISLGVPVRMI